MTGKLIDLLKWEGTDLLRAFEKASMQGKGTPQEVSDFREGYFNVILSRYFPFPHRITKSRITDSFGKEFASIDSIIINPIHPYTIDVAEKQFSIVLADGVDAAIELKPDISKSDELERGLAQIHTVKVLRRRESPLLLRKRRSSHLLELSRIIPSTIFSVRASADPIKTARHIQMYYKESGVTIDEQVDYVVINQIGIIANYKCPEFSKASDKEIGVHFEEWRENTLAAFILKVNEGFPATPTMQAPILQHYLRSLTPFRFFRR